MPPRSLRVFAFGVYAGAIAMLTHWPRLSIEGPVPRTDLWIHMLAFAIWTGLFIAAEPFGRVFSTRNIARSALGALFYTVCDELTQGIPPVHRTIDPVDILANSAGVGLAVAMALAGARFLPLPRNAP